MTTLSVQPTYPIFTDSAGQPLENGFVWMGQANLDPQTNPVSVFWDKALTIPAVQPIRTLAGYPSNSGTPGRLYVGGDYSIRVMDKKGSVVYSALSPTESYSGGVISGIDASRVSFTQSGAGALTRTVQDALQNSISLSDFCVGDGSDEYTKLQQALTEASTSGRAIVDFSGKTYNYGTTLNVGAIEMYGNFTLNGTGSAFLNITGSLTEIGYISTAATKGANTITLSSAAGLSKDDLVILWNSVPSSYSPHRAAYYDGEFSRVENVSGSNVTLQSNLLTSYSGLVTDKVYKSNAIKVVIDGPSFTGDGVFAARIQYGDAIYVSPTLVKTSGSQAALVVNKCYNALIEGGKYHAPYDGVGGNYGISVSNSQFVLVRQIDAFGGRHSVTTGGDAENGAVPCRYVYVEDSILTNDPASGVYNADFHGNTIDSHYKDCTIYGRVGLAGENVGAIDCEVHSWPNSDVGPLCMHEVVGGRISFEGCTAVVGAGSTSTWIVGPVASSLTANISKPYTVDTSGLDATLNANVTHLVNAFENSGQPNAWVLDDFGIRGTLSGLVDLVRFTKVAPGIDASYIYVTNPRFDVSPYTLVGRSGTTLSGTRFLLPSFVGSSADGSWTKFPDGTMICRLTYSVAATAINTAFLGGFRTGGLTWTYPVAFIAAPEVSITPDQGSCFSGVVSTAGLPSATFFLTSVASQAAATLSAKLVAVGRWY